MRIDYSEPKKSYVTPQVTGRPRKEPSGFFTVILIVTGIITFSAGFGTGWFLSQKSAKKSYQAAIEQNSLESSPPKEPATKPQLPVPATVQPPPAQIQPDQPPAQQLPATTSGSGATEPPLSFYKTLPNGQKGNVLGTGINTKDEKAKQPLQAAIPANLNRSSPPDQTRSAGEKTAKNSDSTVFTVQVASFPLKSEAETLKSKLTSKGYSVFIVESNQGEKGIWYRVRVGKRLEQEAAKELAGKLGKTALVIPDRD
jgi:cell division septation protein DedD